MGRAEGASVVFDSSDAVIATNWLLTPPLQKLSANHYFYDISFPPLFTFFAVGAQWPYLGRERGFGCRAVCEGRRWRGSATGKARVAPPERWYRTRRGYPYLMEVPQGCNHTQKYHPKKTPQPWAQ